MRMTISDFQLVLTRIHSDIAGWATIIELSRIREDLDIWLPRCQEGIAEIEQHLAELRSAEVEYGPSHPA